MSLQRRPIVTFFTAVTATSSRLRGCAPGPAKRADCRPNVGLGWSRKLFRGVRLWWEAQTGWMRRPQTPPALPRPLSGGCGFHIRLTTCRAQIVFPVCGNRVRRDAWPWDCNGGWEAPRPATAGTQRVGWTGQKTQHSEREGCPGTDKGRARNGGKAGSRHPEDAVHASVSGSHPSHREGLYPRASRPKASEAHFAV